jgi:hypothetical protein
MTQHYKLEYRDTSEDAFDRFDIFETSGEIIDIRIGAAATQEFARLFTAAPAMLAYIKDMVNDVDYFDCFKGVIGNDCPCARCYGKRLIAQAQGGEGERE